MFRVVAEGPGGTVSKPLEVTPFVLGFAPDCDLALADGALGARHAQLEVQPDGRVVLRDLGSTTGTFVSSSRVEATWLTVPGTFRIGTTQVQVLGESGRPAVRPSPPLAPDRSTTPRAAAPQHAPAASTPTPTPPAASPASVASASPVGRTAPAAPSAGSRSGGAQGVTPMPAQLGRGLWFLVGAGVLEIVGGAILAAALASGALELVGVSSGLLVTAVLYVVGGTAELVLVWFAWRRGRTAADALILLALGLAALAAWDAVAAVMADSGNLALPAVRLGANLGGAAALLKHRSWFAR